MIREQARAKINLTLTVRGRRADGYHELESLVTFADVADEISLQPGPHIALETCGPFASEIAGGNIIEAALHRLRDAHRDLRLGIVTLVKHIPVAAGIGGGSADAAAVLRAVQKANPDLAPSVAWHEIAAGLGADVPVCLAGRPALMWGAGEKIESLSRPLPGLPAVLVNPRLPLPTGLVFAALQAGAAPPVQRPDWHQAIQDREQLLAVMHLRGNDLERPATSLLPAVGQIKAALGRLPRCRIAALSGSGPTCFGIFADDASAIAAAAALSAAHPQWWVVATNLAGA